MILALAPTFMDDIAANGRDGSKAKPVTLTILGTGDAFASGGRAQAGYLLEIEGKRVLLEAGPAVLGEMKRHGIEADSLDRSSSAICTATISADFRSFFSNTCGSARVSGH